MTIHSLLLAYEDSHIDFNIQPWLLLRQNLQYDDAENENAMETLCKCIL